MSFAGDNKLIELTDSCRISRGSERTCYIYPGQPEKCIKVENPDSCKSRQQAREKVYFSRLARKRVPWEHIPAYYGTVDTNMGKGLVFSLIRDFDGSISRNLKETIEQRGLSDIGPDMERLKAFFYEWSIITCDMSLTNFLVQWIRPDMKKVVMIDGLGNREFVPLSNLCASMAAVKMRRRWRRFDRKLARLYSSTV